MIKIHFSSGSVLELPYSAKEEIEAHYGWGNYTLKVLGASIHLYVSMIEFIEIIEPKS
ncbi:MAG: hypothetical protein ACOH2V_00695 [Candidatus Saccharimonadaceae bacterium]